MTNLILRADEDLPVMPLPIRVVAPSPSESDVKWAAWQERGRQSDRAFERRMVRVGAVLGAGVMAGLAWFVFRN